MSRATTPPPRTSTSEPSAPLTPEQVRRLQENRLKAKAAVQARESSLQPLASTSSSVLPSKRPLPVASALTTSPTAPTTRTYPTRTATRAGSGLARASAALQGVVQGDSSDAAAHFQRGGDAKDKGKAKQPQLRSMITQYVDYDLSVLKNSRGGFLVEGEGGEDPKAARELELIEQNKRRRIEDQKKQAAFRAATIKNKDTRCVHCGKMDIDEQLRDVFGVFVCHKCKQERPEEYSLLTKTECKEDYLLSDPELKDAELLPHLLRPNPHRPTYSNMALYLRCQVEAYAFSPEKWGSPEALDAEFAQREQEKKERKEKKFAKRLSELRKKTKTNVWHKRMEGKHVHVWDEPVEGPDGTTTKACKDCGFEIEVEVF